ncbi:hypothetical protein HY837_03970, partial [archaeon]|nr:hypothetical protein [archaeon]
MFFKLKKRSAGAILDDLIIIYKKKLTLLQESADSSFWQEMSDLLRVSVDLELLEEKEIKDEKLLSDLKNLKSILNAQLAAVKSNRLNELKRFLIDESKVLNNEDKSIKELEERTLVDEGYAILRRAGFPVTVSPSFAHFLAKRPADLEELRNMLGVVKFPSFLNFFLLELSPLINEETWPLFKRKIPIPSEIFYNTWDEYWEAVSSKLKGFTNNYKFSLGQSLDLLVNAANSGAYEYFNVWEVLAFFDFNEKLLNLVKENSVSIVYSIDKSCRILGVLFHSVMSKLSLTKNMKFYFILGTQSGRVEI